MPILMVDLDNTLINFSQMFFNYLNNKYNLNLDVNKITTYDMNDAWEAEGIDEKTRISMFEEVTNDTTFYQSGVVLAENNDIIFSIIRNLKKEGYKIVLNSKVSSSAMDTSKREYIAMHTDYKVFDEIILDRIESGVLNATKPFHYDVIIDDSPYVVTAYLDANTNGRVILPLTLYNQYLLNEDKYKDRIFALADNQQYKEK